MTRLKGYPKNLTHNAIEAYTTVTQKIPFAVLSILAFTNKVNSSAFAKRDTLIQAVIKL
jgi:hypothetical protein